MIRVLLADDENLIRSALASLLAIVEARRGQVVTGRGSAEDHPLLAVVRREPAAGELRTLLAPVSRPSRRAVRGKRC